MGKKLTFALCLFSLIAALIVFFGFAYPSVTVDVLPEAHNNPNVQEHIVANSIRDLALDVSISLWNRYFVDNVVYSPLSIGSLMSLLLLGSRGLSFEQLKKALFFADNVTDATIHETFQYIVGSLELGVDVQVNMSTRLFIQNGFHIDGTYQQIAQALYDAGITQVDFQSSPVQALQTINNWISKSTNGKIQDIAKTPFDHSTTMVAVNTILFNGPWEYPFDPKITTNGWFDTGNNNISVPMMSNIVEARFLPQHRYGFDMIALPYKGKRHALYIMMPRGRPGIFSLVNLENRLSSVPLAGITDEMKLSNVRITIPRMKMKFRDNFKKYFEDLGATAIFDPHKANFGRMTTDPNLFVKEVVHEAILEITETGTVAAAATAASATRVKPSEFVFNKPSILFIRDETNGLILFWGRVVEPDLV